MRADGTGRPDRPAELRRRRRARRLAAAWIALVTVASLVDPAALASLLGPSTVEAGAESSGPFGFGAAAGTIGLDAFVAAHLLAYGVLAWLVADGLGGDGDGGLRPGRAALAAVVAAVAVGLGVELAQAPLAARTASATDAAVNGIGAVVGVGARAAVRSR